MENNLQKKTCGAEKCRKNFLIWMPKSFHEANWDRFVPRGAFVNLIVSALFSPQLFNAYSIIQFNLEPFCWNFIQLMEQFPYRICCLLLFYEMNISSHWQTSSCIKVCLSTSAKHSSRRHFSVDFLSLHVSMWLTFPACDTVKIIPRLFFRAWNFPSCEDSDKDMKIDSLNHLDRKLFNFSFQQLSNFSQWTFQFLRRPRWT